MSLGQCIKIQFSPHPWSVPSRMTLLNGRLYHSLRCNLTITVPRKASSVISHIQRPRIVRMVGIYKQLAVKVPYSTVFTARYTRMGQQLLQTISPPETRKTKKRNKSTFFYKNATCRKLDSSVHSKTRLETTTFPPVSDPRSQKVGVLLLVHLILQRRVITRNLFFNSSI